MGSGKRVTYAGMDESLDNWFAREILAHEASLARYLARAWGNRDEVHDLRQEIYVRIYEAAAKSRPTAPKAFLFTTARHLMADRLRRTRIVSIEAMGDLEALNVPVDDISAERRVSARQELRRFVDAFDLLPPRCREVVWLRRVEDVPQKEVARRLGITEKTVENQVSKGMRLLADLLHRDTQESAQDLVRNSNDEYEREHGKQYSD